MGRDTVPRAHFNTSGKRVTATNRRCSRAFLHRYFFVVLASVRSGGVSATAHKQDCTINQIQKPKIIAVSVQSLVKNNSVNKLRRHPQIYTETGTFRFARLTWLFVAKMFRPRSHPPATSSLIISLRSTSPVRL
jgi:hypothetical protein